MLTSDGTSEEMVRLRRAMRDLVALSTLPAIWVAGDPKRIARSLADALAPMLDLDLVYIRLEGACEDGITEVVRGRTSSGGGEHEIGQALAPLLEGRDHERVIVRDPFGDAMLRTAVTRFGHSGDFGALVAGSSRPDFPTEIERLLLGVGANQIALVLQRSGAERAVHQERERLRVTLASIGDAVITTDAAGRIESMNVVAQELTGWSLAEAAGRPLDDVFRIVNEFTGKSVESPAQRALREGRIVGLANHTLLIAKNGEERPIDDSAAPIRDAQGGVAGVVLVFRDGTERRRAEDVLRERTRLAELRAETSAALALLETSSVVLQQCAASLVRQLGLAFARIWTLGEDEQVLVLRASAGMYTHLDGPHSRIEVGRFKIGRIAESGQPHLTNFVSTDPNISDPAWAEREGLVAFAGYPLAVEGRVVGVLGMFSRAPLSEAVLDDLAPLSDAIAQFIERKRGEEAVRRGDERLRMALTAARMVAWQLDPATGNLDVSDNAADVFGLPPGSTLEHANQGFALVHADDVERHRATVMKAADEGGDYLSQFRMVHKGTGAVIWLEERGHAVSEELSPSARLIGVVMDITERKRRDEERERLVSIVENSPDFIGCSDADGNPIFLNRAGRELVGLDQNLDIRTTTTPEYFVPEERGFVEQVVLPAILKDGRWTGELAFQHFKTGAAIPVLYDLFRVDDPVTGRPINFATVTRDITERKRAEETLRASQQRLRFVMDSMPQKIFTATPTGDVDYFNPVWSEFTGLSFEQIRDWGWTRFIHPDDVDENVRVWKKSIETGAPFDFEHRFRRADGEYRWHVSRAIAQRDAEGRIVLWIGSNTDIHDVKCLEASLREADRRKDEFLATLAHELRNPLAPIRTGLELMRVAPDDRALIEQVRGSMESQTRQLVRLIDDLLDISRITSGKVTLRLERVELASVVRDAIDAIRQLVEALGHELTVALPAEPILLDADSTRLAQIFSNLLTNAARYTKVRGRIHLAAERQASEVVVTVTDTGIGIPAEMLDRIFEMFAQVDRSLERSQGGLGIGLALVKRLVELHGGSVAARSAGPGQGSEFTVRLPAMAADEATASPETNGEAVAAAGKLRILVVDDNVDAATVLAILLKTMGNETRIAHDGLEAIEMAAEFRPKILLMDIGMPRLNGYEAARRIRAEPWGKDMLLVALTGWGQDEDRRRTEEAGFDRHLVKPVDPAALREVLAELQAVPDAT